MKIKFESTLKFFMKGIRRIFSKNENELYLLFRKFRTQYFKCIIWNSTITYIHIK